jgi:glycerol-3-phosphate dehydrogenase
MKRDFTSLADRPFDLLVTGGGIYGAWTAYDAALRGLNVALVEQNDWASATSSASSKLIHGGLRYLESYDFKLVKKALAERQRLLSLAPHRVWPLRFGVPVYRKSRVSTLKLAAGLILYDFLANASNPHRHFNAREFAARFPALETSGLKSGFTYLDAQTDDARLALELIDGAVSNGAACVNYCKLVELIETNGKANGAFVRDEISGAVLEVRARKIVHAIGQWAAAEGVARTRCRLTKGVHLVMPQAVKEEALLLTHPQDGRAFFVIPWYGLNLVGTTDTDYMNDINEAAVEQADIEYLLNGANHYLKAGWSEEDIIGCYAGVRVMRDASGAPSSLSRDWELKTAPNGVHYSIGGKITSSRTDAESIVNRVCEELNINAPCQTSIKLFPWMPDINYAGWEAAASQQAAHLGIEPDAVKWPIRRHGKRVNEIYKLIEDAPHLKERILPSLPFIKADLLFCAREEMAVHLKDLLRRRMPLLILAKLPEEDLRRCAGMVAPILGWDDARMNEEITACLN